MVFLSVNEYEIRVYAISLKEIRDHAQVFQKNHTFCLKNIRIQTRMPFLTNTIPVLLISGISPHKANEN